MVGDVREPGWTILKDKLGRMKGCEIWVRSRRMKIGDWRDGLAVKSAGCSWRGPEFSPPHPHYIP